MTADRLNTQRRQKEILRTIAALVVMGLLLAGLNIWLRGLYSQQRLVITHQETQSYLAPYSQMLDLALEEEKVLSNTLAVQIDEDIRMRGNINESELGNLVGSSLSNRPAVKFISLAPAGKAGYIYPAGPNDRILGLDFYTLAGSQVIADLQNKKTVFGLPQQQGDGQVTFDVYQSLVVNGQPWGLLVTRYDLTKFLQQAGIETPSSGLSLALLDAKGQGLWGDGSVTKNQPVEVNLRAIDWKLAAVPINGWEQSIATDARIFNGILILVSLLFLLLVYLFSVSHTARDRAIYERTRDLAQVNLQYLILSRCNQILNRAGDEQQLLEQICRVLVELGTYPAAWVYQTKNGTNHFLQIETCVWRAGDEIHSTMVELPAGEQAEWKTILQTLPLDHPAVISEPRQLTFLPEGSGLEAPKGLVTLLLPLMEHQKVTGALVIHANRVEDFQLDQSDLLWQLGIDLTSGLTAMRTRAAHLASRQEVQKQHRLLSGMLEANPAGIVLLDKMGRCQLFNPRAQELLALTDDEMEHFSLHSDVWRKLHVYDEDHHPIPLPELPINAILMTGEPVFSTRLEVEIEGRAHHWIILNGVPLRQRKNQISGAILTLTDITQFHETEEALRDSEHRYRQLFESVQEGICLMDAQDHIVFVNQQMVDMLGYQMVEMVGRSLLDFMDAASQDFYRQSLKVNPSVGRPERDFEFLHRNGHRVYTHLDIAPLGKPDENDQGVMALVMNVTRRRQRELELEAISRMAKAVRNVTSRVEMIPLLLNEMMAFASGKGAAYLSLDGDSGEFVVEMACGAWTSISGVRLAASEGINAAVLESSQPYYSPDVLNDVNFTRPDLIGHLRSVYCIPLISHEKNIGLVWIGRNVNSVGGMRLPEEKEMNILLAAADIAASSLYRATLDDQTELRLRRLATMRNISLNISQNFDLEKVLEALIAGVNSPASIAAASILKYDHDQRRLTLVASCGFKDPPRIGAKVNRENDYAGYVITNHRFFHLGNLQDVLHGFDRNWTDLLSEFQTYEAIPLLAKGQAKGVLELFFVTPMRMNNEWVTHMYSVASEIAVAMDNLELLEKLGRSNQSLTAAYDATIEGWSRALELRDQETEGHAQRVVDLTLRMAEQVGIPREEWQHIRRGALLHDIGKMAIPDSILFKEGPLDDDEWEIMRRHPLYAYQLLGPIEYLQPALDIPYCHHEHWDGSGYPRGLSGKDIPLAARIFNLVDVWDALRSDRPYRGYWNDDEVLAFLRIQSGKLFDPEMVDLFINMVKKESENPQDLKE